MVALPRMALLRMLASRHEIAMVQATAQATERAQARVERARLHENGVRVRGAAAAGGAPGGTEGAGAGVLVGVPVARAVAPVQAGARVAARAAARVPPRAPARSTSEHH